MPMYITLVNWTDQGIRNVGDTVKRAKDFTAKIQKAKGSVKGVYWTMGRYDAVLIYEAPDDATSTALMISGGSLGNVRTETLRAFNEAEMQGILEKTHSFA